MAGLWGKKSKQPSGAALIVLEGPGKGEEHPIVGELSVGRTQDNMLVRIERGVSRRHCVFHDEGGVYTLLDLKSANGTIINERKIEELEVLRHGDRIVIGETTYLFHWPDGKVDVGISTSPGIGPMGDDTKPGNEEEVGKKTIARKPAILVALVLVGVVFVGGILRVLFCGAETFVSSDLSDEPISYSDSTEFRRTAFGLGAFDDAHSDKVIIDFEYRGGRATLRYSAWGIDEAGEVVLRLNDTQLGEIPVTQEYRHEIRFELPSETLQDGLNRLEFDNVRNPPDEDQWEVGYVRIDHEPLLPPNVDAAREQYGQGLRFYEDREVDPANRFHAFEKFRMTRNLLEAAQPKPPMHQEATVMMERLMEELQEIFELGRFSAERSYRFGDIEEARGYLRRTLRYFPEQDDVRREHLDRALTGLEEQ